MSDVAESFISSRLPIIGLAAYSLHRQNQVLKTQCLSKSLYPSSTEQMLKVLTEAARNLLPAGQTAARYCWVFECLRVYVAARADGVCLALLVENNSSTQMSRIQDTLQGFLDLSDS